MFASPRRPRKFIISTAVCCCITFFLVNHRSHYMVPIALQSTLDTSEIDLAANSELNRELRLIIPATNADSLLCKTVVSAHVLQYSPPLLVNFDKTFDQFMHLRHNGTHLAKIPGILTALKSFPEGDNQHLVLAIDGLDTWFQLGPSALLSRYNTIIQRARTRTSLDLCGHTSCNGVPGFDRIGHQIVFGVQKMCAPIEDPEHDLACLAPPPSILPLDVFGPETDQLRSDKDNVFENIRPRFLNSGFMLGPVAAVRRLYEEANRRMKHNLYNGSDQAIFIEIFGEQEYARRLLRAMQLRQQPLLSTSSLNLSGKPIEFNDLISRIPAAKLPSVKPNDIDGLQNLDYGITLDYLGELTHTTVFAPHEADWIVQTQLDQPSIHWHIPPRPTFNYSLPEDVLNQLKIQNVSDPSQAPLYTNLYTGIVPSSIHHNAWQHGKKLLLWDMWPHMWWHNLSDLLISNGLNEDEARTETSFDLDQDTFSNPGTRSANAGTRYEINFENGTKTTLHQLCREFFPLFELETHHGSWPVDA